MSDSDEEEIVDTAEFLTDWVEQVSQEPLPQHPGDQALFPASFCYPLTFYFCTLPSPQPVAYLRRDLITYAVGIGCDELDFVYEVCSLSPARAPRARTNPAAAAAAQ